MRRLNLQPSLDHPNTLRVVSNRMLAICEVITYRISSTIQLDSFRAGDIDHRHKTPTTGNEQRRDDSTWS